MLKVCHCGRIACTIHTTVDRNRGRPARQRCRTHAWRKLRAQALERDGHRCQQCGSTDHLQAHHLLPGDVLAHLQTLCRDCHRASHHARGASQSPARTGGDGPGEHTARAGSLETSRGRGTFTRARP
jgi:5-methylcytosine-specific restriction endonuclease McrA